MYDETNRNGTKNHLFIFLNKLIHFNRTFKVHNIQAVEINHATTTTKKILKIKNSVIK